MISRTHRETAKKTRFWQRSRMLGGNLIVDAHNQSASCPRELAD